MEGVKIYVIIWKNIKFAFETLVRKNKKTVIFLSFSAWVKRALTNAAHTRGQAVEVVEQLEALHPNNRSSSTQTHCLEVLHPESLAAVPGLERLDNLAVHCLLEVQIRLLLGRLEAGHWGLLALQSSAVCQKRSRGPGCTRRLKRWLQAEQAGM